MTIKTPTPMITPMMQQYYNIKKEYSDCILFYRLGDFYEMFDSDAIEASRILNTKLTKRNPNSDILMCGVPHHSAERHIVELLNNGKNVAICEQFGDSNSGEIITRKVVRVYTPSNLVEFNDKCEKYFNIVSIFKKGCLFSIATLNMNNGDFTVNSFEKMDGVFDIIKRVEPIEIISNINLSSMTSIKNTTFKNSFFENDSIINKHKLSSKIIDDDYRESLYAANGILKYLKIDSKSIHKIKNITSESNNNLIIDNSSFLNLNLIEGDYSLFNLLNKTKSSSGARRLRESIKKPFNNIKDISNRIEFINFFSLNKDIKDYALKTIINTYDIERIASQIATGNIKPQTMRNLSKTISDCLELSTLISKKNKTKVKNIFDKDILMFLSELIDNLISCDNDLSDDVFIKYGYNSEIDDIINKINDVDGEIIDYIEKIRDELIKTDQRLININLINSISDGICIEVSKKLEDCFVKATKVVNQNSLFFSDEVSLSKSVKLKSRYKTKTLCDFENDKIILNDRLKNKQNEIFESLINECAKHLKQMIELSNYISEIDLVISLLNVGELYDFKTPVFDSKTSLTDTYHPLLILNDINIVKNNISFDNERVHLITGPNMSGKSTFMKQAAVIIIMSQIGCPIPYNTGTIKVYDKILSRVGANDDMSNGKSTFMVEMVDIANIFNNATENSFVVIDEVGRGTCPVDGEKIAIAITEGLIDIGCDTLISTHYSKLSNIDNKSIKKLCFRVNIVYNELEFTHKLEDGASIKSYAFDIAKIAGIPSKILNKLEV